MDICVQFSFENILNEYQEFCQWAVDTATADSASATDFLGWLGKRVAFLEVELEMKGEPRI